MEFEADFSGSLNCDFVEVRKAHGGRPMEDRIEQRLNQGRILNSTGCYQERVLPEMITAGSSNEILEKRTDLAKIVLHENWKLKSKFKFTLHNPPREKQEKFIRKDKQMLTEQYIAFLKAFMRDSFVLPFEKLPLPVLKAKLLNGKKDMKFIDLSFLPRKTSVFDPTIDNPFDIVIHWRRPSEFMIMDYKNDLH